MILNDYNQQLDLNQYQFGLNDNNMGIKGLAPTNEMPSIGTIAGNIAKNKALEVIGGKIGEKVGLAGLGNVMGFGSLVSSPIGLAALGPVGLGIGALTGIASNSLFARSKTFADYFEAKREKKAQEEAIQKDIARDMQEQNRADKTGGYQAGYDRDFMEGSGRSKDMGST